MTGGSNHRKTDTEQGWLQSLWKEAKEHRKEAGDRCVGHVAQAVGPPRAQCTRQGKKPSMH